MLRVTPDVILHTASDGSGVVLYNDYSGDLLRLPHEMSTLIRDWQGTKGLTSEQVHAALQAVVPTYAEQVFDALLAKHMLIETQDASA